MKIFIINLKPYKNFWGSIFVFFEQMRFLVIGDSNLRDAEWYLEEDELLNFYR